MNTETKTNMNSTIKKEDIKKEDECYCGKIEVLKKCTYCKLEVCNKCYGDSDCYVCRNGITWWEVSNEPVEPNPLGITDDEDYERLWRPVTPQHDHVECRVEEDCGVEGCVIGNLCYDCSFEFMIDDD